MLVTFAQYCVEFYLNLPKNDSDRFFRTHNGEAVEHVQVVPGVSERRACRILGQPRATQRYIAQVADDEEPLRARIVALMSQYGRYGYRRITALLRREGWCVNHKRVERIWRQEGKKA